MNKNLLISLIKKKVKNIYRSIRRRKFFYQKKKKVSQITKRSFEKKKSFFQPIFLGNLKLTTNCPVWMNEKKVKSKKVQTDCREREREKLVSLWLYSPKLDFIVKSPTRERDMNCMSFILSHDRVPWICSQHLLNNKSNFEFKCVWTIRSNQF